MTGAPLVRLVAAATLVVAATGGLGPTVAPAAAAPCSSGSGVTVVVDPGALGGAPTTVCDSGSGQAASARYADAGVALTYAQRQPGFVCRVDGAPASDPCVNTPPADAYWGLWWSDGESGTWTYSSIGVTGLQVPDGGAVALAWQQGSTRRTPAVAAPVHVASTSSPAPTKTPTKTPTGTASPTPASPPKSVPPTSTSPPSSPPSSTPSPTAVATTPPSSPSRTPSNKTPTTPSNKTSTIPSTGSSRTPSAPSEAPARTTEESTDAGRVPTWVTLTVLVLLLVAIGVMAAAARRRRSDLP